MSQYVETACKAFTAGAAIAQHLRVKLSSAKLALAGANDDDLGTLEAESFADGDVRAVRLRTAQGTVKMVAAAAISAGARVFQAASGKIDDTSTNGKLVGIALEAATADNDVIEVLRSSQEDILAYAAVAASAAVSNTTTETAFDKAVTIPANTLRVGDVIRVRAQAIATATNGTDTLDLALRLGTTDILATGAVDVANNDLGFIDADIVIRTIGASGTMVAAGHTALGAPGTVTSKPKLLASTAVDTTVDLSVNLSATWSVANAGNSVRLDVMDVQLIRKITD